MSVAQDAKPILVVEELNVHYDTGKGPAKAVNDVYSRSGPASGWA